MGRLTTHVLDTALGCPARGIRIELFRVEGEDRQKICEAVTNNDGRCDNPILEGDSFVVGIYELIFHAGAYLDTQAVKVSAPKFLDVIAIRFGVAAAEEHYHVPLLLSPYSYSTYRGS